jgi:hypothetical protein
VAVIGRIRLQESHAGPIGLKFGTLEWTRPAV